MYIRVYDSELSCFKESNAISFDCEPVDERCARLKSTLVDELSAKRGRRRRKEKKITYTPSCTRTLAFLINLSRFAIERRVGVRVDELNVENQRMNTKIHTKVNTKINTHTKVKIEINTHIKVNIKINTRRHRSKRKDKHTYTYTHTHTNTHIQRETFRPTATRLPLKRRPHISLEKSL